MHNAISKTNSQIEKTYELLEQDVYTTEIFLARNKKLTNKKISLLEVIAEAEHELNKIDTIPRIDINATETLLSTYVKLNSAEGKNQILKALLNKVEYSKDTPNSKGQRENKNFELVLYPKLPNT